MIFSNMQMKQFHDNKKHMSTQLSYFLRLSLLRVTLFSDQHCSPKKPCIVIKSVDDWRICLQGRTNQKADFDSTFTALNFATNISFQNRLDQQLHSWPSCTFDERSILLDIINCYHIVACNIWTHTLEICLKKCKDEEVFIWGLVGHSDTTHEQRI